MKRSLLWLAAGFAALFLSRRRGAGRPRTEAAARTVGDRWAPLLYAITSGLAEAWRISAAQYCMLSPRERTATEHGWRGGAAGSVGQAIQPAPPEAGGKARPTEPSDAVRAVRQAANEPSWFSRWWQYLKLLFQRFGKDQCPVFASALAFFGLLSIVPVLLVAIAALGYLIHDPAQAREQILRFVQELIPGRAAREAAAQLLQQIQFENQVRTLMERRGVAGVIGVLTLIWAALQIFVSAVPAMNAAWEVQENRSWLKLRLVALGLLVGAGALFLLSLLLSSGPDLVRRLHLPWLGLPEHVPWPVDLLFTLLAVAMNAAMFTLIYGYLPAAPVTWRQAAVGGITMGVLWELAKQGFSLYLATMGERNPIYETLSGTVILVTWIYYTSMLLLLGAEVAKLHKDICEVKAQAEGRRLEAGRHAADYRVPRRSYAPR